MTPPIVAETPAAAKEKMKARILQVIQRIGLLLLPLTLCSCGVYQAVRDEKRSQGYSYLALTNPITAIVGTNEQPTQKELEEDLADYAATIRNRNVGKMTSDRVRIICLAMDKIFRLDSLQTKSEEELYQLFGKPDSRTENPADICYAYTVSHAKHPPTGVLVIRKKERNRNLAQESR